MGNDLMSFESCYVGLSFMSLVGEEKRTHFVVGTKLTKVISLISSLKNSGMTHCHLFFVKNLSLDQVVVEGN